MAPAPAPAPATAPAQRERTFLTNTQKLQLREFWAADAQLPVEDVAAWARRQFGATVGRATLYRIGRSPASAFAGVRGSRKKSRRVKFPELERDVLAFCLACIRHRRALTDELLLETAARLRDRHGISSDALKLSNGWLHSFKERHALRAAVHANGDSGVSDASAVAEPKAAVATTASIAHMTFLDSAPEGPAPMETRSRAMAQTTTATAPATDQQQQQQQQQSRAAVVTPLTYVSVKALSSVQAVSFLNWERVGGMRDEGLFDVVDDGVCVRRGGKYQINADIRFGGSPSSDLSAVFKVYVDASELLGECSACLQGENGVSLSAFQLQVSLPANAVVGIQFVVPGFALHSSRLVIKLVTAACVD